MRKTWSLLVALCLCLLLCACSSAETKQRETDYLQATALFQEEKYDRAVEAFTALGDYKDSQYLLQEAELARDYEEAVALLEKKDYAGAYTALSKMGNYKDVLQLLEPFQKVLLTVENWGLYYEICDELDRSEAVEEETGGYSGMNVHYVFSLKEEYRSCLYQPEKNTLMTGIKADYRRRNLEMNEETGEYSIVGGEEHGSERKAEVQKLEDGCRALISTARVMRSTDDEGQFVGYMIDCWMDFEITSFSGALYLYQE